MYGTLSGWFLRIASFFRGSFLNLDFDFISVSVSALVSRVLQFRRLALLFFFFGFSFSAQSATNVRSSGQKAKVVNHGALVYKSPSFDSKVIARLQENKTYLISYKLFSGAFYKIKVRDGLLGYIADTDVSVAAKKTRTSKNSEASESSEKSRDDSEPAKKERAFEFQKYRGFEFARINYREDTMGLKPTQGMNFFGFKLSGPNVAMEGSYTDANFLFAFQAPSYYEQATGNAANGFVMIIDSVFETALPQGKNTLLYYGFGPFLKYSKFDVALTVNGKSEAYELVDMGLGAVFNLGLAQRVGSVALRTELQYYWEKMQYMGLGISLQFPF